MKEDVLNRNQIVNSIICIVNRLSELKKNACFTIDGPWGSGKTYILDYVEEELRMIQSESTNSNRYCILDYNAWEYDYYEEPAVAIVTSITDSIGNNPEGVEEAKKATRFLLNTIIETAGKMIEYKTGIDPINILKKSDNDVENKEKEKHEFDKLYSFRKEIKLIRNAIAELAKYETVIFLVDEIDRCLPQYALRVLERLHHIFSGIENVIVIVAVDSKQLEQTILGIYGTDYNSEKYLKKIVNFSISIDSGKVNDALFSKYSGYFDLFKMNDDEKRFVLGLIESSGIEIRGIDRIIEKALLAHTLLDTKSDSCALLSFELLFEIIKYKGIDLMDKRRNKSIDDIFYHTVDLSGMVEENIKNKFKLLRKYLLDNYGIAKTGAVTQNGSQKMFAVKNDSLGLLFWIINHVFGTITPELYTDSQSKNDDEKILKLCKIYSALTKYIMY